MAAAIVRHRAVTGEHPTERSTKGVHQGSGQLIANDQNGEVQALVDKDKQRLPIVAVGSAWAMQKSKVTIKPRVDEDTLAMNIKPAK